MNPVDQMIMSIEAVFNSWNNDRARVYRNYNDIPHDLGTAVNISLWSSEIWVTTVVQVLRLLEIHRQERMFFSVNS